MIALLLFMSCSEDIQYIGGDLVDDVNFSSGSEGVPLVAYTKSLVNTGVQTSGPSSGALGTFNHPLYGQTTADVLSQVVLSTPDPQFNAEVSLDSVVFYLPFYSNSSVDAEGVTSFTLDSVFGGDEIRLSMYRSNYFLNDLNPNDLSQRATYFSNQLDEFDGARGEVIFSDRTFEVSSEQIRNDTYVFDSSGVVTDTTITNLQPGIYGTIPVQFWEANIAAFSGSPFFANNNAFKNFFRGVYLESLPANGDPSYFLFDLFNARITLFYELDGSSQSVSLIFEQVSQTGTSQDVATTIVGYQNDFRAEVVDEFDDVNTGAGEENLYLKGGQGAMAVIDLFGADIDGDGIPEELEALRAEDRIIRNAEITFFVDQEKIEALGGGSFSEPERLYLYDLSTNNFLVDYARNSGNLNNHSQALVRDENGNGVSYTINVTEYIKQLLLESNDSPSTSLGVVVTENIISTATGEVRGATQGDPVTRVPFTSIFSQKGTVLHGNQSSNLDKRLKLEIFYTDIDE